MQQTTAAAVETAFNALEANPTIAKMLAELAADTARTLAEQRTLAEIASLGAERDSLASELLAARQAVEDAAQSRDALDEIHRALDEARARASLVQR